MRWIHRWSVVFFAATLLVAVVYVVSPTHVQAVTTISQVGVDIDGEAASDQAGWSVAMSGDGSRIAIGAPYNDGTGSDAGHVRVYTLINGTWAQTGADINGEAAVDRSGWSVAMSGDGSRIAIGAYRNDGSGSDAGHVRVYTLINGTWTQTGADINGEAASDESGFSVAMSGDGSRIAVGARNNGGSAGHVRVYTLINGTWTQTGVDIDGEAANDRSGHSVAMSEDGSRIAIGAPNNDGNGSNAGHVRVYTLINGTWTQTGLDIDGEAAGDLSGWSVATSDDGSRIAIGAIANRSNAGHVRVYTLINGTWTQTGLDIDGEAANDSSGWSVAMSGDGSRIAIGARNNDGNGSNAGHVRVYTLISGTWTQTGADINGEAAGDLSGYSVAMSDDGSRIAIGAIANRSNAGHVRVYTLISGTWTQTGADIDGEAASDRSGYSVAMSGDGSRIAIGAYLNGGTGSDAGHVRVYTLINGTWTQTGADIDGEAADDVSGTSVAMSKDGSRIAIGAPNNDGTGSDAGHARVYTLINGTWTQTGADIDGEAADDYSGYSVAMSDDGSRIAIGAYSNDGNGSNAGHVRVFGVPSVPVAPTITSVVGTDSSLTVTFASGADGGSPITNYKYSIDGTNYIGLNPATTSSPFIISGLTNATTYSVTIKAVNVYGDSLKSNMVSGTPIAPTAIVEPTTTTVAAITTTVAATTTTTIAAVVISSTKNELPETGSDSFPLFALALGLLSAGLVVTTRKRFARR